MYTKKIPRSKSLDISPYHTKQKFKSLINIYSVSKEKDSLQKIKDGMPYFDIRHPDKSKEFTHGTDLRNYYFRDNKNNIFKIMNYNYSQFKLEHMNWDEIKISELLDINGPGIYIHHACRPFDKVGWTGPTRENSLNTLKAAQCPIKTEIYDDEIVTGKYYGCDNLEKIIIGKNVTSINHAFGYCTSLTEVIFEKR